MSVTFAAYNVTADEFADVEDINVNNSNAARILRALGFDDEVSLGDLCGSTSARDFQARVVLARRFPRDDYMTGRLDDLFRLASAARAADCVVSWA
ncbi:hypothetical protein [Actinophytocola sp.]|uniref:hypothetical protein n=1 Tax=Actinophytocola sp. TaxID=1872138 RepID=UPI002D7F4D7B|nr:hypothetical protein [Actinophytocola sp.]HET9144045.1 hypothetical protein [Actinophytocola sp.]